MNFDVKHWWEKENIMCHTYYVTDFDNSISSLTTHLTSIIQLDNLSMLGLNNIVVFIDSDEKKDKQPGKISGQSTPSLTDEDDMYSNMGKFNKSRKLNMGLSCSDAEVEYRRGRSLRECREDYTWHQLFGLLIGVALSCAGYVLSLVSISKPLNLPLILIWLECFL